MLISHGKRRVTYIKVSCFVFKTKLVWVRKVKVRYLVYSVRQGKLLFVNNNAFTSKLTVSLRYISRCKKSK